MQQPSQGMTVAHGRETALEVGRSGYIGTELKIELAGLADGKDVGVRKREKSKITPTFYTWDTQGMLVPFTETGKIGKEKDFRTG